MKYLNLFIAIILLISYSCKQTDNNDKGIINDPFFGAVPPESPQLLAPNLLASPAQEYNGTFSPDGKSFYYTTDIPENAFITFTELLDNNTWSEPKVASFSGEYSDFDPLFSPDGSRLYFSSSRPLPDNMNSKIWYVEKKADGWSEPKHVALTGSENNEYYSSITNTGNIYFNIWSNGKIYKANKTDTAYTVNELPEVINGDYDKGDPFISPNEDYLIFRAYRDDSYGRGDLYISFKINGNWTAPENLGEPINSAGNEMCPYVTVDGKMFIFSSNRVIENIKAGPLDSISKIHNKFKTYNNGLENIYYMSTKFIDDFKKKHSKPND